MFCACKEINTITGNEEKICISTVAVWIDSDGFCSSKTVIYAMQQNIFRQLFRRRLSVGHAAWIEIGFDCDRLFHADTVAGVIVQYFPVQDEFADDFIAVLYNRIVVCRHRFCG
jgi:hypothetical protein